MTKAKVISSTMGSRVIISIKQAKERNDSKDILRKRLQNVHPANASKSQTQA
jgi:hypothetical protein